MAFDSVHSYSHFAAGVRSEWRYVRSGEQVKFLEELSRTATGRYEVIPKGTILYRAQLGCDWPETQEEESHDPGPRPFGPARMKPLRYRAQEGRVNPLGMPCLYMATKEETAAAEVRPWIGANVSVAQMEVQRDLNIVDCSSDDRRLMIYWQEPDAPERERAVWRDVDRAFAQPAAREDGLAEYAPTQVIAEWFRREGADGVGYRSSLGPGHNIAVFDLAAADVINCTVLSVSSVTFSMSEAANRYYVRKK